MIKVRMCCKGALVGRLYARAILEEEVDKTKDCEQLQTETIFLYMVSPCGSHHAYASCRRSLNGGSRSEAGVT